MGYRIHATRAAGSYATRLPALHGMISLSVSSNWSGIGPVAAGRARAAAPASPPPPPARRTEEQRPGSRGPANHLSTESQPSLCRGRTVPEHPALRLQHGNSPLFSVYLQRYTDSFIFISVVDVSNWYSDCVCNSGFNVFIFFWLFTFYASVKNKLQIYSVIGLDVRNT